MWRERTTSGRNREAVGGRFRKAARMGRRDHQRSYVTGGIGAVGRLRTALFRLEAGCITRCCYCEVSLLRTPTMTLVWPSAQ